MIDFEQDAAAPAGSDALQRIADLARLMVEQQAAVTAADSDLAAFARAFDSFAASA